MPRYEYKCEKCEKEVTLIRKVEDRDAPFHCICGETPKRQISLTGEPRFSGNGWTPRFFR